MNLRKPDLDLLKQVDEKLKVEMDPDVRFVERRIQQIHGQQSTWVSDSICGVTAPRQSGKTFAAIEIKKALGDKVEVIVPNDQTRIYYENQGIVATRPPGRGYTINRNAKIVIVDEVSVLSQETIETILVASSSHQKLFLIGTPNGHNSNIRINQSVWDRL